MKMEAPEYLDLDEIDFSDDSVVSIIKTSQQLFTAPQQLTAPPELVIESWMNEWGVS